jgi:isopenicillin-N N-acyltransferase-like protein
MMSEVTPALAYRRRSDRPHIVLDAPTPFEKGRQRGRLLGNELIGGLNAYMAFFCKAGLSGSAIRDAAMRVIDTTAKWRFRLIEEFSGIASAAGVEIWQVAALNARTEILGLSTGGRPGECSTLLYAPSSRPADDVRVPFGVQTWDWNQELNDYWHTQSVSGGQHHFVGVTEHGILGKIGINSAGLAVFLNILAHEADGVGGIPVHVLAATVLEEAGSVQEGIDLLTEAPIFSSTALTLMDSERAVSVELSPVGVFQKEPVEGYLLRTNHFLVPEGGQREKASYAPDSQNRYELVSKRLTAYGAPRTPEHLIEFLYSDPEQAHLCCLPQPGAELGRRWRTLATIVLDPHDATADILDGSPVEQRSRKWVNLRARASS